MRVAEPFSGSVAGSTAVVALAISLAPKPRHEGQRDLERPSKRSWRG